MERAVVPAPARSEPAGEAVAGSRLPLGWALLLRVLAWWPSYLVPRSTSLTVRTVTPPAESPSLPARRARSWWWASAERAETSGPNGVPSSVEVAASAVGQVANNRHTGARLVDIITTLAAYL